MEKITAEHPLSQSPDFVKQNIETLKQLFPTIVKEGKIDLVELQALLGQEVESEDEYYRFTWAGKSMARREANKPSTATLRPDKESSKDWDTTQNIFVEGDNLEVLKLLQKSYANRVKMIYIDPPYNTGNDFVYKDDYADNLNNYLAITGQVDEEGKRRSTNSESDGRYHSNWLNMIYPRLRLARNLLVNDGVIFISIGQDELKNLTSLADEVFGEENRISILGRLSKSGGNKGKFFSPNIQYILCYAKNVNETIEFRDEMSEDLIKKVYTQVEKNGERQGEIYRAMGLYQSSLDPMRGCTNQRYFIEAPDGTLVIPNGEVFPSEKKEGAQIAPQSDKDGVWRWTYPKYLEEKAKGNVEFKVTNNDVLVDENGKFSIWNVNTKIWLKDRQEDGQLPTDFISKFESRHSSKEVEELGIPFEFPKPIGLIKYLAKISGTKSNDVILDFFAGSGTTAHAIFQLNSEDCGERRFICIQLPEKTGEKTAGFKAGYKTIAEITKERIRRAGEKVKKEIGNDLFTKGGKALDIGFKAFKLDSSNLVAWDGSPENLDKNLLNAEKNIKDSRTAEDVLYEILLKHGLDLALPIEQKKIAGKAVFNIGLGTLFICLDDAVTTQVAEGIGKWKQELEPATCKVIFKDNGLTDVEKTNSMQILKRYGIEEVNTI